MAATMGVKSIERHFTLDRNMYGSDQNASIEPCEMLEMVKNIRKIIAIRGNGRKELSEAELAIRKKLRGK